MSQESNLVRLDKWLWAARFFKTRSIALTSIKQGKVLYNGQKSKPSREVEIGAILKIQQGFIFKTVEVLTLSNQRGPANVAQKLYQETAESILDREKEMQKRQENRLLHASAPKPSGRPDKRARSAIKKLRREDDFDV